MEFDDNFGVSSLNKKHTRTYIKTTTQNRKIDWLIKSKMLLEIIYDSVLGKCYLTVILENTVFIIFEFVL